jgi:cytoplasmic FMR1 interacting protein
MIKDAAKILWQMESIFNEGIRSEIYDEIQLFTQRTLREAIRYVTKKKKMKARTLVFISLIVSSFDILYRVLLGIRETCADWLIGTDPVEDPCLKGDKDGKYIPPSLRHRECGVGTTQVTWT